VKRALSH